MDRQMDGQTDTGLTGERASTSQIQWVEQSTVAKSEGKLGGQSLNQPSFVCH